MFKKLLIGALFAVGILCHATAAGFSDEDLTYVVEYKWGLINKDAGTATLSLRHDGNRYNAQLTAKTLPWADKFYRVRDTLSVTMKKQSLNPDVYRKISHEGGSYSLDVVKYTHSGSDVIGNVTRLRQKKNTATTMRSDTTLYSTGSTFDMLSVFYYLRQLDYSSMSTGARITTGIFSGKSLEKLTVTYRGVQQINVRNKTWSAHYLTFSFTHNGKSTGETMTTWISVDSPHIPLKVVGKLAVGKVQAFYTGS
jgi:hypothetical protein